MAVKIKRTIGEPREGVVCYRGPDGSTVRTVHFYTDTPPLGERSELTADEKDVARGIVHDMAVWFNQYVEKTKALERQKDKTI